MFEQLDFVYIPSRDAAADVAWFTDILGARLVFAIEGMGTRVAMVELTADPPAILLAEHLEGDRPVLVYRVADLNATTQELRGRGWEDGHSLEIPQGPVRSFRGPGGSPFGDLRAHPSERPGVVRGPSRLLIRVNDSPTGHSHLTARSHEVECIS